MPRTRQGPGKATGSRTPVIWITTTFDPEPGCASAAVAANRRTAVTGAAARRMSTSWKALRPKLTSLASCTKGCASASRELCVSGLPAQGRDDEQKGGSVRRARQVAVELPASLAVTILPTLPVGSNGHLLA